jgi:hypothetical protein
MKHSIITNIHLSGPEAALDHVARAVLGVPIAETKSALRPN